MNFRALMIIAAGLLSATGAYAAGDAAKGAAIATTVCAACHGADGNSVMTMNPKLAGQHPEYLVKQLNNFKSGERANAVMAGMAATLAIAWFTPENLYIANVGDSRIYRSRDGVLEQLSRDHTAAWGQWKRREICEMEYRTHPRRAALYEVVGGGHERVNAHFAAISYQAGDRFLVCSDGVIDGLWERHISNALANCPDDPATTAHALLKRAIDNSGIDDTSLIVIAVTAPPRAD